MVEVNNSPARGIVLSETTCQDTETWQCLQGKKDPPATIEQLFCLRCCLIRSDVYFYRTFLLHQRSKVISTLGSTEMFRVLRRKANQIQSESEA